MSEFCQHNVHESQYCGSCIKEFNQARDAKLEANKKARGDMPMSVDPKRVDEIIEKRAKEDPWIFESAKDAEAK
jgi:hypothetical protein